MIRCCSLRIVALAAAFAWPAADALAQFPGGGFPGGGGSGGSGPMGGRGDRGGRGAESRAPSSAQAQPQSANALSRVDARLAELRTLIRPTKEQQPAWDRYSLAVYRLAGDVARSQDTPLPADATGPQRLERVADVARNRLTAIEDVVDAGKALYATLTPEQRAAADARIGNEVLPLLGGGGDGGPRGPSDRRAPRSDAGSGSGRSEGPSMPAE